jgi:hypothetical protein
MSVPETPRACSFLIGLIFLINNITFYSANAYTNHNLVNSGVNDRLLTDEV